MSKYTYEDYIGNGCHPTGYNESCQSYIFSQSTVDTLLDKLTESVENKLLAENCIKNLTNRIKKIEEDYGYINQISHELGLQNFDYEKQVALLKSSEKCLAENVNQLKQQLAEKEKELQELRFKDRNIFPLIENLEDKVNQDKFLFCIEKLEKVKEQFKYKYNSQLMVSSKYLCEFIDNQIKQLKEKL